MPQLLMHRLRLCPLPLPQEAAEAMAMEGQLGELLLPLRTACSWVSMFRNCFCGGGSGLLWP